MTRFLAGAIGLIVVGAIALVFGWIGANEILIWVSIIASGGAAVLLALAYQRGRGLRPAAGEGVPRPKRRAKKA